MSYNDKPHVTMEPMTREMMIPKQTQMIGVVGDNEGERVDIDIPRWYDGIDLGTKSIYIVVSNDEDHSDMIIPDVTSDEEQLHITWIVKSNHVSSEGIVYAHIRATDEDGFVWQSLDGEYRVRSVNHGPESMPDGQVTAVNQKIAEMDAAKAQAIDAATDAYKAAAETAPPIICAASGTTSIAISDSADRPLRGLTVYGKTTQDGTPGMDAPVGLTSVGDAGNVELTVARGLPDTIVIIKQPRHLAGAVGDTAIFEVIALGYGLKYRWQYKGTATTSEWTNTQVDGYGTARIIVPVTQARDGFRYRCVITDVNGHTVATKGALLTVGDVAESDDTADETQTATISTAEGLRGVPVASGAGTYTDADGQGWIADTAEYDAETGVAQYIKRTGTKTLDETAAWKKSTNENVDRYYTNLSDYDASMVPYMLCSIGTVKATKPSEISVGFVGIDSNKNLSINYAAAGTTTLDDFLAYIAENPITVVYPIAAPIETVIDADDVCALRSRYPETTVYNDAAAHMEARYVADTKNYVDQKIEQLTNALVSTGANI